MANEAQNTIRLARAADALVFAKLLHAFNVEFGETTPSAEVIAERAAPLLETGELASSSQERGRTGSPSFASVRLSTPERSIPTSRSSTSFRSAAVAVLGEHCSSSQCSTQDSEVPLTSS